MAEVSYLHLHDKDEGDDDVIIPALDSAPYWSHDFDIYASDVDFPTSDALTVHHQAPTDRSRNQISDSDTSDLDSTSSIDREIQLNFVRSNHLDLDLDLGLGFSMDAHNDDDDSGFIVPADCGDEFFVSRRDGESDSCESSTVSGGPDCFMSGLRGIDFESYLEEAGDEVLGTDLNPEEQLHFDSFQLEDDNRDGGNDEFEWEEVDDEREVLSMLFDAEPDEVAPVSTLETLIPSGEEAGGDRVAELRNLEWEVLLNLHNLEANPNIEHGHDEYNYTEYEMMFGQFGENENASFGRPPASKIVVENLQSVILVQEEFDNSALCAVCKDEINVGEMAKQLPCAHRYHGDCIVPWLGIRNTCPVCRYELPTDDPNYERRRRQRGGSAR
ncbi:hypothetical protein LguiB_007673 [Lonicera macranthoides]